MAPARSETRRVRRRYTMGGWAACERTMTPFFLSIFPALFRLGDLSQAIWQWKRWASERAAIKAEVTQAKQTADLLRMARAITRLDAFDAEIDAFRGKPNRTKIPRLRESSRSEQLR
jgi:hypothetical protein